VYHNPKTGFITYRPVELNKIYVKNGNDTVAEINISDNWKMEGWVIDPAKFPWSLYPLYWDQERCEVILTGRVAPNRGPEFLKSMGLDKYDTMTLIYMNRGIQVTDDLWFAWSEDDRAEDYHPNFNPELRKLHIRELKCLD